LGRRATSDGDLATGWLRFAALASLALAGCSSPQPAAPIGASTVALHPVVDFAYDSLDDRPVTSDATRGKATVLAFFTTGSIPAQAQINFLLAMAAHDAAEVNYAAVSLDPGENRVFVELYRNSLHIPFPVAMADTATRAGEGAFGDVSAVPVTVVLDRAGRVVWRSAGRVAKSDELRGAMRGL
jgi:hypothetical protein